MAIRAEFILVLLTPALLVLWVITKALNLLK